jgi:hypothetical protein
VAPLLGTAGGHIHLAQQLAALATVVGRQRRTDGHGQHHLLGIDLEGFAQCRQNRLRGSTHLRFGAVGTQHHRKLGTGPARQQSGPDAVAHLLQTQTQRAHQPITRLVAIGVVDLLHARHVQKHQRHRFTAAQHLAQSGLQRTAVGQTSEAIGALQRPLAGLLSAHGTQVTQCNDVKTPTQVLAQHRRDAHLHRHPLPDSDADLALALPMPISGQVGQHGIEHRQRRQQRAAHQPLGRLPDQAGVGVVGLQHFPFVVGDHQRVVGLRKRAGHHPQRLLRLPAGADVACSANHPRGAPIHPAAQCPAVQPHPALLLLKAQTEHQFAVGLGAAQVHAPAQLGGLAIVRMHAFEQRINLQRRQSGRAAIELQAIDAQRPVLGRPAPNPFPAGPERQLQAGVEVSRRARSQAGTSRGGRIGTRARRCRENNRVIALGIGHGHGLGHGILCRPNRADPAATLAPESTRA